MVTYLPAEEGTRERLEKPQVIALEVRGGFRTSSAITGDRVVRYPYRVVRYRVVRDQAIAMQPMRFHAP
jgi:hypothetical protein